MIPLALTVELVPLVAHTDLRAVAILRGHDELTAGPEYDAFASESVGKRLRHKMGLWISFVPDKPGKFHRFKSLNAKYTDCFVFIDLDEKIRLYGFTCHPTTNKRFELVVLTIHAIKKETHTDESELNRVVMWQNNMATRLALMKKYPNRKDEKKS